MNALCRVSGFSGLLCTHLKENDRVISGRCQNQITSGKDGAAYNVFHDSDHDAEKVVKQIQKPA